MNKFTHANRVDNQAPSVFEWFEQEEGRGSDRSRRLTFMVLFNENGWPRAWLLLVGAVCALVAIKGFGGF